MKFLDFHFSASHPIRRELSHIFFKLNGNSGQGLLEYSMILILVSVVVFTMLQGLGITLETCFYQRVNATLENVSK